MARKTTSRLKSQNNRALREFVNDVYGAVRNASLASMHQVAQIGLTNMINQAQFSDFTGVLANSYQAAIKEHGHHRFDAKGGDFTRTGWGRLNENFRGYDFKSKYNKSGTKLNPAYGQQDNPEFQVNNNTFSNSNGMVSLYTSYNYPNTSKISFKKNRQGRYPLRKNRGGVVKVDSIWDRYKHGKKPPVDGYGRVLTELRTAQMPNLKDGYSVIFANGAPYARYVHNHFNRVFPSSIGISRGQFIVLAQRNLKASIALRKGRRKKKR